MGKSLKIVLNKENMKSWILAEFDYVLFYLFFISVLNLPSAISYITDIINLVIGFYFFYYKGKSRMFKTINMSIVNLTVILLCGVCFLSAIINLVPPTLLIWAARNSLRFFIFFYACICFLDIQDVEKKMELLVKIQIVNVLITAYQYFVLGLQQDYLGGIFGKEQGVNGITNIYFCIIISYVISQYLYKKINLKKVVLVVLSCLIIAAAAELKVFFIEFAIIIIFSIILAKPSFRVFSISGIAVGIVSVAIYVYSQLFPVAYEILTSQNGISTIGYGVGGGYNISRFGAFQEITDLFFKNNLINKLIGFGFGNCEYSSFKLFTSEFFQKYSFFNYRWFSHQMWFLECGYLGIVCFLGFFISIIIWIAIKKKSLGTNEYLGTMVQVFSIIMIINTFYNQTSRIEISYISFFVLASVFICYKSNREG